MSDSHTSFGEHFSHNENLAAKLSAAVRDTYKQQVERLKTT